MDAFKAFSTVTGVGNVYERGNSFETGRAVPALTTEACLKGEISNLAGSVHGLAIAVGHQTEELRCMVSHHYLNVLQKCSTSIPILVISRHSGLTFPQLRKLKIDSVEQFEHCRFKLKDRIENSDILPFGWTTELATKALTCDIDAIKMEVSSMTDKVKEGDNIVTDNGNMLSFGQPCENSEDWRGLGQMVTYLYPHDKDRAEAVRAMLKTYVELADPARKQETGLFN